MPYNRPPLSKELLAHELADAEATPGTDADNLAALHERIAFRRRASVADVTFRLGVPVTGVDLSAGELALADGDAVRFDGLVVATGLRPRQLNVPGPAGPGSGRHVLRTLDDCASLRAGLRAALARPAATAPGGSGRPHVVVVGAGFIGCEVACTALSLGCDVTVVEPGPPMLRVLGGRLAQAVQRAHELAGITFVLGQGVVGLRGPGTRHRRRPGRRRGRGPRPGLRRARAAPAPCCPPTWWSRRSVPCRTPSGSQAAAST